MQEPPSPIILFDGFCNLCSGTVNFVLKHDKEKLFHFTALQSQSGRDLLSRFGLDFNQMSTVVLIEGDAYYFQSMAVLRIMGKLPWPYRGLYCFIIFPEPVRNFIYDLIAKNRYRLFGKRETCDLS